jgi:hypothetical protein
MANRRRERGPLAAAAADAFAGPAARRLRGPRGVQWRNDAARCHLITRQDPATESENAGGGPASRCEAYKAEAAIATARRRRKQGRRPRGLDREPSAGRQVSYGMYSAPPNTVCSTNNVLYVSWN